MEKITIFVRTIKTEGSISLRFYLSDGRKVRLYHKSSIVADIKELEKYRLVTDTRNEGKETKLRQYEPTIKPRTIYDRELFMAVSAEVVAMKGAYNEMKRRGLPMDGKTFEAAVDAYLYPEKAARKAGKTMLARLTLYVEEAKRDGLFGVSREKHFNVLIHSLERFFIIIGQQTMTPAEFTPDVLLSYRKFVFDEYEYVPKWRGLYVRLKDRDIPTKRRNPNTVSYTMKMLQAFFTELESNEEIEKSPFAKLGTDRKRAIMKTKYNEPIFLRKDEFLRVMETDVPDSLMETKEAFLLQCAFGCRISDFKELSMDKVSVSDDGIPFIHYLPIKTKGEQSDNKEVKTPIVRFALDIIRKTSFNFHILSYVSGKSGYNVKIKSLLEHCGIDRKVAVYNSETGDNEYKPLYEMGSSKICRKTFVDMMSKVQVDLYASGLHKAGSSAVHRYTSMELKDRFALQSVAFEQPMYVADSNLNIIG